MLVLMALSGVIGIGLGDSLFFAGLNRMGARRMLLLFTINPVITVLVAWVFMGEPLVAWQLVGVALTCGGVAWVIAERNSENSDGHVDTLGILFGLVAASCQATGVLMSRYVFEQGEMTAVSSAWLRLAAGSVVLILLLPIDKLLKDPGGQAHHHPAHPSKSNAAIMFTAALMLGTVGGIWLMQIAVKESDRVGIASTLLSTSPLFILPIVAMLGEHISKRAVFGAIISIAGIALLYLFSA
jgi:drug/metabolite transporter (DMT)-like permease